MVQEIHILFLPIFTAVKPWNTNTDECLFKLNRTLRFESDQMKKHVSDLLKEGLCNGITTGGDRCFTLSSLENRDSDILRKDEKMNSGPKKDLFTFTPFTQKSTFAPQHLGYLRNQTFKLMQKFREPSRAGQLKDNLKYCADEVALFSMGGSRRILCLSSRKTGIAF